jgi:hypothetical protein
VVEALILVRRQGDLAGSLEKGTDRMPRFSQQFGAFDAVSIANGYGPVLALDLIVPISRPSDSSMFQFRS